MSKFLYNTHPLNMLFDLLRSDAHVSVNKALMFAIGVNEALVFSELLSRQAYFQDRNQLDEDGYFFNTVDDLKSGTSLSDYQQRVAINNLKKLELINVHVGGIPPKRFFRINDNSTALVNLLNDGKIQAENARKPTKMPNSKETSESILKKFDTNKNNLINEARFLPEHELGSMYIIGQALGRRPRKVRHDG